MRKEYISHTPDALSYPRPRYSIYFVALLEIDTTTQEIRRSDKWDPHFHELVLKGTRLTVVAVFHVQNAGTLEVRHG